MAMRVHSLVWENSFNRTLILGFSLGFLAILIELFFLFYPRNLIEESALGVLVNTTFTLPIGDIAPIMIFIHTINWLIIYFVSVILYSTLKEAATQRERGGLETGIVEIAAIAIVPALFTLFMYLPPEGLIVTFLFLLGCGIIIAYLFLSLHNPERRE